MGLGNFLKDLLSDGLTEEPTTTRRVIIDQTGSRIHTAHAQNVTANQIGGTINNNVSSQPQAAENTGKTSRKSYAIGVVNWSDYDEEDPL